MGNRRWCSGPPPPPAGDQHIVLEAVADTDVKSLIAEHQTRDIVSAPGKPFLITAADSTTDTVAIRTYGHVWIWRRSPDVPLWAVFAGPPCEGATVLERQGEALALTPVGTGYFTVSEGTNRMLNRFDVNPVDN